MIFLLKFTNPYGQSYYLQNWGDRWAKHPEKRLVGRTTADAEQARPFDSKDAADEALATMTSGKGWEVVIKP